MSAKNIALGTLLGMGVASSMASAAPSDNFKGFNLSVGPTAQSSTFKTHEKGAGTWDFDNVSGESGAQYSGSFSYDRQIEWPNSEAKFGTEIDFGYNFKVGDNFLLGMSLTGDIMKLLSGKTQNSTRSHIDCAASGSGGSYSTTCFSNYSTSGGGGGGGSSSGYTDTANMTLRSDPDFANEKITLRNHYGVVLRPMFVVTDQTAVYLKVSYNQATASGFGPSVTVRGPGYGAGFETNLSQNWFLRAELEQILYSGDHSDHAATINVSGDGGASGAGAGGDANMNYRKGTLSVDSKVTAGTIAIGLRF